jgi:hypothetical protein
MNFFRSLCAAVLGIGLFSPAAWSQIFYTLLTNSPTAKRINIVFLAEGYTSTQSAQFTNNAVVALNLLLNTPPFSDYRSYFNAFAIFVASAEAGSDHYTPAVVLKNTYFNSTYDSSGIQRLVTIPPNDKDGSYANGRGKVEALLQTYMPEYDRAFLIVNDTQYGGSGGSVIVTSVNSASAQIGVHETGHSYAGLADEYDYGGGLPGWDGYPNTTGQTNRASIKWRTWILDSTPIPTPETSAYNSVIGLFEGAQYCPTNWYRPKLDCYMNHLNVPFCEVCAEAIVKATYEVYVRPIESTIPLTNSMLVVTNNQPLTLSVTTMSPSSFRLRVQWEINDAPLTNATNAALTMPPGFLLAGTNKIRVVVTDPSTKVRNDPSQTLRDTRTWRVDVRQGPAFQPDFTSVTRFANGTCMLRINGAVTQAWQIQWSTDLPQWYNLAVVTNTTGTVSYLDTQSASSSQRFYRVVYSP